METAFDVMIIGAGIAGTSVAAELVADCSVLVLEAEDQPGYHSTGRSAAMWVPSYGPPSIRRLAQAAGPFLQNPPEGFTSTNLVTPKGELMVGFKGEEVCLADFQIEAPYMKSLSSSEAKDIVPLLRADALCGALYDETAQDLDVDALHQGYMRLFRERGGKLVCSARVNALRRAGDTWSVTAGETEFSAPKVINAAGAWCDEIAKLAGLKPVGLIPKRRSAALVDAPAGYEIDPWPLVFGAEESFYFRPMSGQLMVSPADATPVEPHDAWAEDMALAEGIDKFQQATTYEVAKLNHTWGGLRTFAPDGEFVVGFDPAENGFFWLAGQGGYGIETSPAMSRLAAALLLEKGPPKDIADCGVDAESLSPKRFFN